MIFTFSIRDFGHTKFLKSQFGRIKDSYLPSALLYMRKIKLSNAEAAFIQNTNKDAKYFENHLNHFGIHGIALAEYSQMSIPMRQGFSHFHVFASFCIG